MLPKRKIWGKLYRAETLVGVRVIMKSVRIVFRGAVRSMLPLQLDTLSEKLLNERAKSHPRKVLILLVVSKSRPR